MKKKLFIKLFCAVFAMSFLTMACQPTKDGKSSQRQSMRGSQMRESQPMMKDSDTKMPMRKRYNDDECCPKDCCPKSDCEWCNPRCEETNQPTGIYAPMQPKKKECTDCCDPCDDCGCDDCGCGDCGCGDCGCGDCCEPDCCDPCDSCCSSCGPNGRQYTRNELFGRDTELSEQNRRDPRRFNEK